MVYLYTAAAKYEIPENSSMMDGISVHAYGAEGLDVAGTMLPFVGSDLAAPYIGTVRLRWRGFVSGDQAKQK